MRDIFFTSDPHYNHKNLVKGVTSWGEESTFICRDFQTLDEHNDSLVNIINNTVKPQDILYCLGDWSFGGIEYIKEFRDRLHCEEIHLILGNHDHHIEKDNEGVRSLFASVNTRLEVSSGIEKEMKIVLDHFPMESWNKVSKGWIHLHGHLHTDKIGPGRKMDVGIDSRGIMRKPFSLQEIHAVMETIPVHLGKRNLKL